MTRTSDHWEGLAIAGRATVGPVGVAVPAVIESRSRGGPGTGPTLTAGASPAGVRVLSLGEGERTVELRFPVLAPELSPEGPAVHPVGDRAWMVHAPARAEELERLREARPELVVLANARTLYAEGEPLVEAVRHLRTTLGAEPLLWAPRVALPHRVPLLAYLGFDLLDTTEGRVAVARGLRPDATFGALEESAPSPLDTLTAEFARSISETRFALRTGRLRELVESRLTSEPAMAELLRYADRHLVDRLDQMSPVAFSGTRSYVLAESHRRPEMRRFRRRLIERYRPPPSKAVLLLVPCSKTKPYRQSRSHRRFAGALEGIPHRERLHLVSVSSPIGLVPRELEDVPPARHYDIPVTGDWSESERRYVEEALAHLLRTGAYHRAVAHLDPEEYGWLHGRLDAALPTTWTLRDGRTTSAEALVSLQRAVHEALSDATPVPGGPLAVVREELQEVAAVQFGRPAAERLFAPPVRLAGRPWFQRVTDGTTDLATVREERGLFHLTVAGARRLAPEFPLSVRIDPALSLEGDLFVPGVRAADPEIRVGDSVVLVRDGQLAGVGEAALPGPLMTELSRGIAVRVRHREHRPTDTAMTDGGGRPPEGPVV